MDTTDLLAFMNAGLLLLTGLLLLASSRRKSADSTGEPEPWQQVSQQVDSQVISLASELKKLRAELGQLAHLRTGRSVDEELKGRLEYAEKLAGLGAAAEEIARKCEISPAEAALLHRLHGTKALSGSGRYKGMSAHDSQ